MSLGQKTENLESDLKRTDVDAGLPPIASTVVPVKYHKPDPVNVQPIPVIVQPIPVPVQPIPELTEAQKMNLERLRIKAERDAVKEAEKQRKLAERAAEKARRLQEKQAQKDAKIAERLRREAEKAAEKVAEFERRENERRAIKERRDLEKKQKGLDKKQREAEKQAEKEKKEAELLRIQPRINLFFKSAPNQPSPKKEANSDHHNKDFISAESLGKENKSAKTDSEYLGDYRQRILPFHAKTGGKVFSSICNCPDFDPQEHNMDPLLWLKNSKAASPTTPCKLGTQQFRTQLALAHESSEISDLLTRLRVRRLQFSHLSQRYVADPSSSVPINEEYRPPYVGTTQDLLGHGISQLSRSPFRTDLDPNLYYEYDSEVEWDANDEGDDLRDDDGDDSDEEMEDQEELREFLSSDEDGNASPSHSSSSSRPKLVGPLHPVVLFGPEHDLSQYAVQLLGNISLIDTSEPKDLPAISPVNGNKDSISRMNASANSSAGSATDSGAPTKESLTEILEPVCTKVGREELKASLLSHNNSTGTKTLIVELLKQEFPQALASEIKHVFDSCFERVGKKRNEKKWVLASSARHFFNIVE